jgi:hypothetical protein
VEEGSQATPQAPPEVIRARFSAAFSRPFGHHFGNFGAKKHFQNCQGCEKNSGAPPEIGGEKGAE